MTKDLQRMQNQNDALSKELVTSQNLVESQQLKSAETDQLVLKLKNKIQSFEESSILKIIKSRIKKNTKYILKRLK